MFEIKSCGNGIIKSHPKSQIILREITQIDVDTLLRDENSYYYPAKDFRNKIDVVVLQVVKMNDTSLLIEFMHKADFEEAIKE